MSLLLEGEVGIQGRMPWSSNGTYLVTVGGAGAIPAIYKPGRAERPLWDFPDGLFRREVAAYELAEALGWGFVPETVVRLDAPLGAGSLQRFVEADFEQHYFTLVEDEAYRPALKRMGVFDYVANNADRKGGHCLLGLDGRVWGIDHGLCFHEQPKLRTVIWDFAGEPIGDSDLADLARLAASGLPSALSALLHAGERRALETRITALLRHRRLPEPRTDRPYPWPLV
ncbi:MAG: SCO1664 family protein [Acidimicrobiales bacterium]